MDSHRGKASLRLAELESLDENRLEDQQNLVLSPSDVEGIQQMSKAASFKKETWS